MRSHDAVIRLLLVAVLTLGPPAICFCAGMGRAAEGGQAASRLTTTAASAGRRQIVGRYLDALDVAQPSHRDNCHCGDQPLHTADATHHVGLVQNHPDFSLPAFHLLRNLLAVDQPRLAMTALVEQASHISPPAHTLRAAHVLLTL